MKVIAQEYLTIGDVKQSECYRTENGTSIYMKIKNKTCNAVAIDSGFTFYHRDNLKARLVNGHFAEIIIKENTEDK